MVEENHIKITGDLEELDKVFKLLAMLRFNFGLEFSLETSKSVADYSTEPIEDEEEEEEVEEQKPSFNIKNVIRDRKEVFFEFEGVEYSLIPTDIDTDVKYGYLFRDDKLQVVPDYSYVYALTQLNKVPYTKSDINEVIGINGDWKDLEVPDRFNFIKKLEPRYYKNLYLEYEKKKYQKDLKNELKNS